MFRTGLRTSQLLFRPIRNNVQSRAYKQPKQPRRLGKPQPQYRRFDTQNIFMRWAARPTFYRDVGFISLGAGGFYVFCLEEVPVSGRRRFNVISPALEESLGKSTVEEVKQEYGGRFLPEWDDRVVQVKKVLARLLPYAQSSGLEGMDWEVHVIDSPEQNAFVAPGGKVFVFTGILPLCKDEDGIAAVLGHEIAHVVAHHTAEKMSQSPLILIGMAFLVSFDVSMGLSKLLLDAFLSWPASRTQEAEADLIGLLMMAEGCYRPEAAMEFWGRMEILGQQGSPQILSTHPSHHNREAKIREWLPRAHEKAASSECHVTSNHVKQFTAAFEKDWW